MLTARYGPGLYISYLLSLAFQVASAVLGDARRRHTAAHRLWAARTSHAAPYKPSDSRYILLCALISDRYLSSPCGYDSSCRLQEIFPGTSVACFAMTSLILVASTVIRASRLPRVITLNSILKLHILSTFIQGDT